MRNKVFIKIISVLTALLCVFSVVNPVSSAIGSNVDFMTVDSITICERHGIVEDESIKLTASLMPETAFESSVKWRSSNESVVACTEDGVITGKTPGGYAYIYCESKWGDVSDKIKVYCAEKVSHTVRSDLKGYANFIYSAPNPWAFLALHINLSNILKAIFESFSLIPFGFNTASTVNAASGAPLAMGKCEIKGKYGSYAYISFKSGEVERDGFILFSRFEETAGLYPTLSAKDMNVWGDGIAYDGKTLTTKYNGTVSWKVADDTVAEFNETTGQVTGLKPGVTTITATTADGLSETCTVHSLYKWPQTWTTQTNRDTHLYRAEGSEYKENKALSKNKSFIVYGDEGGSDGWAYGKINGTETWGFIPISHISTKGTISQYNGLGWIWPIQDINYNYINSPYGDRNTTPKKHIGIDISTNWGKKQSSIEGETIVSAFNGTVDYVCEDWNLRWGYCVSIISDETITDPVSKKQFVAIYMHMLNKPKVLRGQKVSAGKELGYVGSTGNSTGPHLHFEVNNQTASIYEVDGKEASQPGRSSYNDLINPIFFYIDKGVEYNEESDAVKYYKGAYWYGNE